jgi:hypothetical protein
VLPLATRQAVRLDGLFAVGEVRKVRNPETPKPRNPETPKPRNPETPKPRFYF